MNTFSSLENSFEKTRIASEKLLEEQEKLKKVLQDALDRAEEQKSKIVALWENLNLLIKMVQAYIHKQYTQTPWRTILISVAAIIYFINPLDFIPDIAPALGFLDDATVVAFVVNAVKDDLENFKSFLQNE